MNLWMRLSGMMEVEITSAQPEQTLRECSRQGIDLYGVSCPDDLTVRMIIRRTDWKILVYLCEKRGDALRILRKRGLYWMIRSLLHRPVLTAGVGGLLFLTLFLPGRILFVEVTGNQQVPARAILEAAEESGVGFWASRRSVRSEKVKNALLEKLPRLQWAGVNTFGCRAVIQVRERPEPEQEPEGKGLSAIVAARDGIITSCVVTKGSARCAVGQAVKGGQLLVSPYTDCGISIRVTEAEGEIFGLTSRKISAVTPVQYRMQTDETGISRSYSLVIGKKRINLWKDSGICTPSCDRMYEEYYITLPGGFSLPVCLAVERVISRETEPTERDAQMLLQCLEEFARCYAMEQMVSGEILDSAMVKNRQSGLARVEAAFVCREMIGRVINQKIGETDE